MESKSPTPGRTAAAATARRDVGTTTAARKAACHETEIRQSKGHQVTESGALMVQSKGDEGRGAPHRRREEDAESTPQCSSCPSRCFPRERTRAASMCVSVSVSICVCV